MHPEKFIGLSENLGRFFLFNKTKSGKSEATPSWGVDARDVTPC